MPDGSTMGAEAERLAAAADRDGLGLRLMGGVAVWLVAPSVRVAPFAREYADLDLAVRKRDSSAVTPFMEREGYVPERLFNSIHGAQRLNFAHADGAWTVDVVIDALRMSHVIDLRGRLETGQPTIDLADLLLTKLQIWEINEKDLGDITCLLADRPLSDAGGDGESIAVGRVLSLTGNDWGLCHTMERNLRKVADFARDRKPSGAPFDPVVQAEALLAAIAGGRKTLGWQLRRRVGERMRWYETPEEVRH